MGQAIPDQHIISKDEDSSFYSICEISKNEFWVGGENGILFLADSNSRISRSTLNLEGCTVLKIVKQDPFVFLITDSQVVFRYHPPSSSLKKFNIPECQKKCFYDIAILPDGKVLLCGGNKQVTRVKKCIPRGFIAETDTGFHSFKIIWKSARKFVWSLTNEGNDVYASTFNGMNSKIISRKKEDKWKYHSTIKGIAYRIYKEDGGISAIGAASLKFRRNGILHTSEKSKVLEQSGCIWNRRCSNDKLYCVSNNGEWITTNKSIDSVKIVSIKNGVPIYDFQKISSNTWMFAGHGKAIFFHHLY